MLPPFDIIDHYRACKWKQTQRSHTISSLPPSLSTPLTPTDHTILSTPLPSLIASIQSGTLPPTSILDTYTKTALLAHAETNCLTEILYPSALPFLSSPSTNLQGPLAGIPVSLKDSLAIRGVDSVTGYSANVQHPSAHDGAMVRLLRDAGAVPFVKTNVPTTMLSFESVNDVFGATLHPSRQHRAFTPGGSTGGEGALLALNGSRVGVGSDVAGSVRIPAAWSGVVALRCSTGRWPKWGGWAAQPGQEGVPAVYSPMARTVGDLVGFARAVLGMGTWRYDHTCHPLPWREGVFERAEKGWGGRDADLDNNDDKAEDDDGEDGKNKKPLRIGLLLDDGLMPPSPPILRALELTATSLEAAGHTIIRIPASSLPTPADHTLSLSSRLLTADGCTHILQPLRTSESLPPDAAQLAFYTRLSSPLKLLHSLWIRYLGPRRGDSVWARLLEGLAALSTAEQWRLVKQREDTRAAWFAWWDRSGNGWDCLLCPVHALPGMPRGGAGDAVAGCGWTVLWNLLDWTAGALPVTRVRGDEEEEEKKKKKGEGWRGGDGDRVRDGVMRFYDPESMKGLPCAVQIVGRRLEEERILGYMSVVEKAVRDLGGEGGFELMDVIEQPEEK